MSWELAWSDQAARELRRLDTAAIQRVGAAVTGFAETERGNVRRLQARDAVWRLRVGDWRVLLAFDRPANTMTVLHVLPRGRAYRR